MFDNNIAFQFFNDENVNYGELYLSISINIRIYIFY